MVLSFHNLCSDMKPKLQGLVVNCSYPLSCPEIYSWFSQHPHPIKKKKLVEEDGEEARGDFLPGPEMRFALADD